MVVRLGEHDTSTDNETSHIDIYIERQKFHPDLDVIFLNDISILYLQNEVEFTGGELCE